MDIPSPTSPRVKPPLKYFHVNPSPAFISSPAPGHRPPLPLVRRNPIAPRLRRCLAASTGPPPQKEPIHVVGFSRLQEHVQIFFAVLFWMSLFFWAPAFDKRNNGGPNRGSRFRG